MRTSRDFTSRQAVKTGPKASRQGYAGVAKGRRRLTAMSLPVAVSVALLVPVMLKKDLNLVPAQNEANGTNTKR
jgi:hypothetical protein